MPSAEALEKKRRNHYWNVSLLIATMVAVFVVGGISTWIYQGPVPFQRFGSVGVAQCIIAFGVFRLVDELYLESVRKLADGATRSEGGPESAAEVTPDLRARRQSRYLRFGIAEVGLLTLSTLQWGYGDWLVCQSSRWGPTSACAHFLGPG